MATSKKLEFKNTKRADLELPEFDKETNEIGRTLVEQDSKVVYEIKQYNPFGWSKITTTGGNKIPDRISGWYTSKERAEEALARWHGSQLQ